jgi:hypothetical protein
MLVYSVSQGALWYNNGNIATANCYSGYDEARNDSTLDDLDIGPIPRGTWYMLKGFNSKVLGERCIPLLPLDNLKIIRKGFFIHSSYIHEKRVNGIEVSLSVREKIDGGKDRFLLVIQ